MKYIEINHRQAHPDIVFLHRPLAGYCIHTSLPECWFRRLRVLLVTAYPSALAVPKDDAKKHGGGWNSFAPVCY